MNVLLIGGTGNFGKLIAQALLNRQDVENLSSISRSTLLDLGGRIFQFQGDLNDGQFLRSVFEKTQFDVVICIPNILLVDFGVLLPLCRTNRVKQLIVVGSAAMYTQLDAPTRDIRLKQEERIRNSGINYTILRPNMVYGHKNDQNIYKLYQFLKKYPIIPVPGSADILQNPTYIADFVDALLQSMLNEKAYNKSYNLVGPTPISLRGMVQSLSPEKKIRVVEIPLSLSVFGLKMLRILKIANWHPEKLLRLNEEKVLVSTSDAFEDLHYAPKAFDEVIKNYYS